MALVAGAISDRGIPQEQAESEPVISRCSKKYPLLCPLPANLSDGFSIIRANAPLLLFRLFRLRTERKEQLNRNALKPAQPLSTTNGQQMRIEPRSAPVPLLFQIKCNNFSFVPLVPFVPPADRTQGTAQQERPEARSTATAAHQTRHRPIMSA